MASLTLNHTPYTIHQTGNGDPILILHGFTGDGASFIQHLPRLAQTHRLIAPDLLGHGATISPPHPARYKMENAIADLSALLAHLNITSCTVLGYSMGGRLALGFALSHPDKVHRLILESSSAGLSTASERETRIKSDEALAERILTGGIEAFVDEWERLPLWDSQSADIKASLRAHRLKNNPLGLANSLRGMGTGAQPYFGDRLTALTMPVLLITGEKDAKFTTIGAEMVQKIPRARLVVMPNVGHTVHLEAPETYQEAVTQFLRYNE
ncbi:MAG: 2-succinyl-6-hydroxy-2,4-cyclohexadiene-1-carboxylate synthase [Anaerolineae bacterium]|nr:2-succinyl-6-hydroxy-2,4-cyclohexadiene-1-carboxylate synthase [Anaerolineae bacterium]